MSRDLQSRKKRNRKKIDSVGTRTTQRIKAAERFIENDEAGVEG